MFKVTNCYLERRVENWKSQIVTSKIRKGNEYPTVAEFATVQNKLQQGLMIHGRQRGRISS